MFRLGVIDCTGLAGKIWDAGYVLTHYLAENSALVARPKRCIELGAGTGVSGIAAALLGADVLITDLKVSKKVPALNDRPTDLFLPNLTDALFFLHKI